MAEGGASQAKAWRGHEPRRPWELKEHEIECERRYGEINSSIARFDVLNGGGAQFLASGIWRVRANDAVPALRLYYKDTATRWTGEADYARGKC